MRLNLDAPALQGSTSFSLFEDDGYSLAYEQGDYTTTTYHVAETQTAVTITIDRRNNHGGKFQPPSRDYILNVHSRYIHDRPGNVAAVTLNGAALPRDSADQLNAGRRCWAQDTANGLIRVRCADSGQSIKIRIRVGTPLPTVVEADERRQQRD